MNSREQAIIEFVGQCGLVRSRDLISSGYHPQEVKRLAQQGLLERVGRGIYMLSNQDLTEWHGLAEVSKAVPAAVINLISALAFHRIGTQLPHQTWIAVPKGAWTPRASSSLRVTYLSEPFYSSGIEEHVVEGVSVKVYCAAKTVADCFRMRSKVGYDVAVEALREGWRGSKFSASELMNYARIDRVDRVIRPYVEALIS